MATGRDPMPIVLLPPPQRIHITRENFALGEPATMAVPSGTPAAVIEALRPHLEALFPELDVIEDEEPDGAVLRFSLTGGPTSLPADVPPGVEAEAYQLK